MITDCQPMACPACTNGEVRIPNPLDHADYELAQCGDCSGTGVYEKPRPGHLRRPLVAP